MSILTKKDLELINALVHEFDPDEITGRAWDDVEVDGDKGALNVMNPGRLLFQLRQGLSDEQWWIVREHFKDEVRQTATVAAIAVAVYQEFEGP